MERLRQNIYGRSVSKTELAILYYPGVNKESALKSLMNLIKRSEVLLCELISETGYDKNCHRLTPRQVEITIKHLGQPMPRSHDYDPKEEKNLT